MVNVVSLNFSPNEREKIKGVLKEFKELKTSSQYEDKRCKVADSTVTLYKTGKLLIQGKDAEKVKQLILGKLDLGEEIVLGFDESGRGENFGAMTVAAVLADKNMVRELRDSKKLKKESLQRKKDFVTKNALGYSVTVFSPQLIDECRKKGINLNELECRVITAVEDIFDFKKDAEILVDGKPLRQCRDKAAFLVKGDDLNPVIGAGSVLAKYAREHCKNKGKRKTWKSKKAN